MKKRLTTLGIALLVGLTSCGIEKEQRIYAVGEVNDKNYYATIVVNSLSIDKETVKDGDNEKTKYGDLIVNCSFTNIRAEAKQDVDERVVYSYGVNYYKYDTEKTKVLNKGADPKDELGENIQFVFSNIPYDDTPLKITIFGDAFADLKLPKDR